MHDHEPASPSTGDGGFVRLRLDVAYDGAQFAGFARQPELRTVQGVLGETLATVMRLAEAPATVCAGRTDAGVHARGQVVQVDLRATDWEANGADPAVLVRRLAGALPRDLRVHAVAVAPAGFDVRFSALWRRYAYRVCDHPAGPDPLRRHEQHWYPRPLDTDALNAASAVLVGQHDFAAFCRKREGATTIRVLDRFDWTRDPDGTLVATVVADAFCHSMVRSMVGATFAVGEGRRDVDWLRGVLGGRTRVPDIQVAGPEGLTLEAVGYPADVDLAARAAATRNRRSAESVPGVAVRDPL
jgi:tRNA pseudouridine38-40 synthase